MKTLRRYFSIQFVRFKTHLQPDHFFLGDNDTLTINVTHWKEEAGGNKKLHEEKFELKFEEEKSDEYYLDILRRMGADVTVEYR